MSVASALREKQKRGSPIRALSAYPSDVPVVGDPGPLPRWFWVTVWAVVIGLVVLGALGVSSTVLGVVFIVGVVAFLLFIAPRTVKHAGGPDAIGKSKRRDQ